LVRAARQLAVCGR
jgi:Transposase